MGLLKFPFAQEYKGVMILIINFNIAHICLNLMLLTMSSRKAQVFPPPVNGNTVSVIIYLNLISWMFYLELPDSVYITMLLVNTLICLIYYYVRVYLLSRQFIEYSGISFWTIKTKGAVVADTSEKAKKE